MICFAGMDLGSTSTKAVLLDECGVLLGCGMAASRSRFDTACRVALAQATTGARLTLVDRLLEVARVPPERRRDWLREVARHVQRRSLHEQVQALRQSIACGLERRGWNGEVRDIAERLIGVLRVSAEHFPLPVEPVREGSFRDLTGAWMRGLAAGEVVRGGPRLESLLGLLERSLHEVQNLAPETDAFAAHARTADVVRDLGNPELGPAVAAAAAADLTPVGSVGTGYGRQRLPFPRENLRSEILCHGLGAHQLFPGTRTVLDIGGQDTKAIQIDAHGAVTSFQMNDRCAAGCGRFLGYVADEMNLRVQDLGPLAATARRPAPISSTCAVFAGAEVRQRIALSESREEILAGLHRAMVLRALSLLARAGGVHNEFTLTGGVAYNVAAVSVLRELIAEHYGVVQMNVSENAVFLGALGAALFAFERGADGIPG